ncbi:MAG: helix-turn-helix domain-containing protein [Candidatus Jordarchaeaceae archaeon]
MSVWEDTLKDIGITGVQAKVYATCVGLGAKTASELAVYTNLTIPEVTRELEKLESMGVIKKIPGKIDFYIALTPRIALTGMVAETLQSKLENLKKNMVERAKSAIEHLSQNVLFLKTHLDERLSSYLKEVKDSGSQLLGQLLSSTKESLDNFQAEANQQSQSIGELLTQMLEHHEKDSREVIRTLVGRAKEAVDMFRSDIERVKETSESVLKDFIEHTRISISEFQEKLETAVNDTLKAIETRTGDVSARTNSELTTLFSDIDYTLDQSLKGVREIKLQSLNTINENTLKIAKTVMSGVSEFVEELKPLTETQLSKVRDVNAALLGDIEKSLDLNQKKLVSFMGEAEEKVKVQTTKLRDLILEESKTVSSKIKEFINNFQMEASRIVEKYKDETTESLNTLARSFEVLGQRMQDITSTLNEYEGEQGAHFEQAVSQISKQWEQMADSLSDGLLTLGEKIQNSINMVREASQNLKESLMKAVEEQGAIIEKSTTDIFEGYSAMVMSEVESCIKEQAAVLNELQDTFKGVVQSSLDSFNRVLDAQENSLIGFDNWSKQALDSVTSQTNDAVKNLVKDAAQEFEGTLNGLQKNLVQEFGKHSDQMLQRFCGLAKSVGDRITVLRDNYLVEIDETLKQAIEGLENKVNYIMGSFNKTRTSVEEKINMQSQQVASTLGTNREELKKSLEQLKENLEKKAKEWEEALFTKKTIDSDKVKEGLEKIWELLGEQGKLLKSSLKEGFQKVEGELKKKWEEVDGRTKSLKQSVKERKDSASKDLRASVENILKRISEADKSLVGKIGEYLEKRTQLTRKQLEDFVANFASESESLKKNLSVNFTDSVAVQKSKMTSFEETFTTAISKMIDILQYIEDKSGDKKKFSLGKEETEELMNRIAASKKEIMGLKGELRSSVNDVNQNINMVSTNILDELDRSLTYIRESLGKSTEKTIRLFLDQDAKTRGEIDQAVKVTYEDVVNSEMINLKNINESSLSESFLEVDKQVDGYLQEIKEIIKDVLSQMRNHGDSCLTAFESVKSGISKQLEETSEVLQKAMIENYETATAISSDVQEQLGNLFGQVEVVLEKSYKLVSDSAGIVTEANLNSLQELSSILTHATNLEEIREKLNTLNSNHRAKLSEAADSFSKQLEELTTSMVTESSELVKRTEKYATEEVSGKDEQIKTLLGDFESKIGKIVETYMALHESVKNEINKILEEQHSFKEQTGMVLNKFSEETIRNLSEKSKNVLSLQSQLERGIGDAMKKGRENILKQCSNLSQRMSQQGEKMLSEATQQLSQISQNLSELLTLTRAQSTALIENTVGQFKDTVESLSETLKSSLKETIEGLQKTLENTNTEAQKIFTQTKQTVSSLLASREEIQKVSTESIEDLEIFADKIASEAPALGSQIIQEISGERSALERNLETQIKESIGATEQRLEELHSDLKEGLNGYVEKAVKLVGLKGKDVSSGIEQEFQVLRKQLTEHKEKLEENLVKTRNEIREKQDKVLKGAKEVTSAIVQELPSYVEKMKYDLLSTLDKHSRESREAVETELESIAGITDKPFASLQTKILDFERDLGLLFEKRHSDLKSKTYETIESVKDSYTSLGEALNSVYSTMEQSLNQKFQEATSNYLKEISKTITLTKINIEENERDSTLALNSFAEEIPEKIDEAIKNTQDTLKLITRIMKLAEEIEPKPFEDTERVVGREQILNLLKTFIRNTKSTITILTPTLEDIPLSELSQIPRQRVILVSDVEGKAIPISSPNIQVKHYSGNVYAFNRDSEEMILAVAAPEPLGIYTTNMELIKLLNLILQDVSARAKKI